MAKIVFSSIGITSIRGRAAGTLFTSNGSGASFGNFARRTKSSSKNKSRSQSIFLTLQQMWRSLTEDERASWRLSASAGRSGINEFLKINTNLKNMQVEAIRQPIPLIYIPPIENLSFVSGYTMPYPLGFVMAIEGNIYDDIPPELRINIFASAPMSAGRNSPPSNMYRIGKSDVEGSNISGVFSDNYLQKFGYPPVGSKIFIRINTSSKVTGQSSNIRNLTFVTVQT